MTGHIRQVKGKGPDGKVILLKNVWDIAVCVGKYPNGRPKYKWQRVTGPRREAEKAVTRLLNAVHEGTYFAADKSTVAVYLERWLKEHASKHVSAKTLMEYEGKIRAQIIPKLGHYPLADLRPVHIESFYTALLRDGRQDGKGGLAPQTVLHIHRVLRKALQQAVKWDLIPRNPADKEKVDAPSVKRTKRTALNATQANRLLELARSTKLYLPVLLALACGLRRGEILALRWRRVDLDAATLTVAEATEQTRDGIRFKAPKSETSRRTLALPAPVVAALKRHRTEQDQQRRRAESAWQELDLVVANEDGSVVVPERLTGWFRDFIARHPELPRVSFHDLRRTSCTLMAQAGVNPKVASGILGHSDIRLTLNIYTEALPEMHREAAARMGDVLGQSESTDTI